MNTTVLPQKLATEDTDPEGMPLADTNESTENLLYTYAPREKLEEILRVLFSQLLSAFNNRTRMTPI
jgi:hypothetical protein